jgi:hypothetical protein
MCLWLISDSIYTGGRDLEAHGSRPTPGKKFTNAISTNKSWSLNRKYKWKDYGPGICIRSVIEK